MDEAGVKGFDMDSWAGIFAPANTPPAIVTQLNAELRKIIDSPEVKQKLRAAGFEAFSSSTERDGRLHTGPARQMGQDDQGRRYPAGVTKRLHHLSVPPPPPKSVGPGRMPRSAGA